jgi:hypothetical protein
LIAREDEDVSQTVKEILEKEGIERAPQRHVPVGREVRPGRRGQRRLHRRRTARDGIAPAAGGRARAEHR